MQTLNIDKIVQHTYQYWYDDGLTEIVTGCLFILIGLLVFLESLIPAGSPLRGVSAIGLPILIIGGMWVGRYILRALKNCLTYPRTGYVAYHRPSPKRKWTSAAIGGLIGMLISVLFISASVSLMWIPLVEGVAVAIFWLFLGRKVGLTRFYVLAVVSVLSGTVISLSNIGDTLSSGAYLCTMGLAMIAFGALTLRTYLAQTHPPVEG